MGRERPTRRSLRRYVLLQIPSLFLLAGGLVLVRRWFGWPEWLLWGAAAAWVAKDVALFPFVWRAYDSRAGPRGGPGGDDQQGVVEERLAPDGWVRVGAELWRARVAEGAAPVGRGEPVRVVGREGLTLRVERAGEVPPSGPVHPDRPGNSPG